MDSSGRVFVQCKCGWVYSLGPSTIGCTRCGAKVGATEDDVSDALDVLATEATRNNRRADREQSIRGKRFIGSA